MHLYQCGTFAPLSHLHWPPLSAACSPPHNSAMLASDDPRCPHMLCAFVTSIKCHAASAHSTSSRLLAPTATLALPQTAGSIKRVRHLHSSSTAAAEDSDGGATPQASEANNATSGTQQNLHSGSLVDLNFCPHFTWTFAAAIRHVACVQAT